MKKILLILLSVSIVSCEKEPNIVPPYPPKIVTTPTTPTPTPTPITEISPSFVGPKLIVVLNRHPTKEITAVYIDGVLQNFDYPIIGKKRYQFRNRTRINVGSDIRIVFSGSGNFNYFNLWRFDSGNSVKQNYPIRLSVGRDSTNAHYRNREALNSITFQDQFSIISN